MLTLSYGFKKPQTNDRGPVVFPALEDNWQQVNDHNHDGVNSSLISSTSISKTTKAVLAAGWSSLGGGRWKQTVTLPGVLLYDSVVITCYDTATGDMIYPSIKKASATQFDIYVNDNTLNITAVLT